jgi:predicted ATPase with chaperone activity
MPEFGHRVLEMRHLSALTRCQKRISGPMFDQIDNYIEVPRVD